MKEIKFRAWDTITRDWVKPGDLIADLGISETGLWVTDPEWKLMQYTGLKDKNGREIYEGDIVRGKRRHVERDESNESHALGVVVWYQENAEFLLNDLKEYEAGNFGEPAYMLDTNLGWVGLEVIGNIYENPELIQRGAVAKLEDE